MSRVLVCSGLDPSGRAGLLADVAAISAMRAYPMAIATALTAQGAGRFSMTPVDPRVIRKQLDAVGAFDAIKLGMVPNRAVLKAIAPWIGSVWTVIDPVVRTSRGERLSTLTPADYLALAGPKVAITPNVAEAEWLGEERLLRAGFGLIVIKGGHRPGAPDDLVITPSKTTVLRGSRIQKRTSSHRGTGCRFASALAVGLARERSAVAASRSAKALVRKFLAGSILGDAS
jgi:hydroxymethylpyrimidine/phosphomethylpyrimidine kinase